MEASVHVVHFSACRTVRHPGEHFEVAARLKPLTDRRPQIALLQVGKFGRTIELHQSPVENRVPKLQRVACAIGDVSRLVLLRNFFLEPFARLNPDRDRQRARIVARPQSIPSPVRKWERLCRASPADRRTAEVRPIPEALRTTNSCSPTSCQDASTPAAAASPTFVARGRVADLGGAEPCEPRRHRALPGFGYVTEWIDRRPLLTSRRAHRRNIGVRSFLHSALTFSRSANF